ncbi:MAG: hypothetical protein CVV27_08630, partial [Candidatus Melainabacteria bacterium HGW-Melainabacteria-1]
MHSLTSTQTQIGQTWLPVCALTELEAKARVLFRHDKAQIVVFISNGQIYAIDNRC